MNADDERFLGCILILWPLAFGIAGVLACELVVRIVRAVRKDEGFWA